MSNAKNGSASAAKASKARALDARNEAMRAVKAARAAAVEARKTVKVAGSNAPGVPGLAHGLDIGRRFGKIADEKEALHADVRKVLADLGKLKTGELLPAWKDLKKLLPDERALGGGFCAEDIRQGFYEEHFARMAKRVKSGDLTDEARHYKEAASVPGDLIALAMLGNAQRERLVGTVGAAKIAAVVTDANRFVSRSWKSIMDIEQPKKARTKGADDQVIDLRDTVKKAKVGDLVKTLTNLIEEHGFGPMIPDDVKAGARAIAHWLAKK